MGRNSLPFGEVIAGCFQGIILWKKSVATPRSEEEVLCGRANVPKGLQPLDNLHWHQEIVKREEDKGETTMYCL